MIATPTINYMGIPGLKRQIMQGISFNATRRSRDAIVKLVLNKYDVTEDQLKSKARTRELVLPRQITMYLLSKYSKMTMNVIGKQFNRDHTTVIHSKNAIDDLMQTDEVIRKDILDLEAIIIQ